MRRALHARRRQLARLLYVLITTTSYAGAYLLRFEFRIPTAYLKLFVLTLLPLLVVRLIAFHLLRVTRQRWRFAGAHNYARLLVAVIGGSLVLLVLDLALPLDPRVPLSVLALEGVLTSWLTGGSWLAYRLWFDHVPRRAGAGRIRPRVLIVGAGESGNLLAREMLRSAQGQIPIGFLDDDPATWGSTMLQLEVIGGTHDLPALVARHQVEEVIIAVPSAAPSELRRIVERCGEAEVAFRVLPGIRAVFEGDVRLNQLRDVRIEDLLGREPVQLELPELEQDLRDRTVLITGAAGSIGSELSRQVALHGPERLVLLDQAETDLFYLDNELRARHRGMNIIPVVGDIVDEPGMERLFEQQLPERVFHAAAYKHVPMMQLNAREAIRNNVTGTMRIAELAGRCGVEKFVLVSTDKAVRPTSVMGATKRLAEMIILDLQRCYTDTTYGAVRFGNVLGSQGSVIPLFKRQLAEGRPLTVTHPDTTRYFMTIQEAVQLILQASVLADLRGRVAMLDMGEPVRILDLAMNLLRLSGAADNTGRVVFTGLRPGEKLHEELSAADEEADATCVPKVRLLRTPALPALPFVERVNAWLEREGNPDDGVLEGFLELFPLLDRAALPLVPARRRKLSSAARPALPVIVRAQA